MTTAIDAYYSEGAPQTGASTQKEPEMVGGAAAGPWPGASTSSSAPTRKPAPRRGGIMTFADLRGSDDTDEKDDPMNLFAGGERSGLNVENPENQGPNHLVNDILRQASQSQPRGETQEEAPKAFTGTGHTLSGEGQAEDQASSEAPRSSFFDQLSSFLQGNAAPQQPLETVQRHLTFWKDGFSLGDGPLMHYDDPEHAGILRAIQSGRAPLDLLNVQQGQEVELVVARRMGEHYQPPPPPPAQPFGGEGNRLGSAAPTAPAAQSATAPKSAAPAGPAPPVDSSKPTTRVQVRLPDGGRTVIQLNQHNTVGELRAHINSARPEFAHGSYTLQGGFPLHPLADETQTVAGAGLQNSVIVLQLI